MNDLVGYDQKARDFILKQDLVKVWSALNGPKGPPGFQAKGLVLTRANSTYSAGDFVRDR